METTEGLSWFKVIFPYSSLEKEIEGTSIDYDIALEIGWEAMLTISL